MSCPTCGHTMQAISTGERHYWCPRCGTLREKGSHFDDDAVPGLVGRCRKFAAKLDDGTMTPAAWRVAWAALGVAESINPPGDRA